ncbi:MAG: cysteine desulfurase family protein [Verrucomicrobiota bacterium]|nr:cysteine desulfurase family protein [Verrucomicrobiota bacterium]
MTPAPIYFDHLSSTEILPQILTSMGRFFSPAFSSPWSPHTGGNAAREALEEARKQFCALVGADDSYEVIFTGNGSEANNLVIKGRAFSSSKKDACLVYTATDHPSIIQSMRFLESLGFRTRKLPVDPQGFVDPVELRRMICADTVLVVTHLVNHDLGTLQPVDELVQMAHSAHVPVLIDATYGGGWRDLNLAGCPADFVTLSPHRFHGPKGVGVLVKKRHIPLTPLIHGGNQEHELRAGHENIPAIHGAGLAAGFIRDHPEKFIRNPRELQKLFLEQIAPIPGIKLNGPPIGDDLRAGNSLSLSVAGVDAEELILVCDRFGLQIAGGSACVSRTEKIPHTLQEIGLSEDSARGTVLMSFGITNTPAQIAPAAAVFAKAVERVRSLSPRWRISGEVKLHNPP